jgi:1-acyl-sn-glycerol-3-phosphate acyltransferase
MPVLRSALFNLLFYLVLALFVTIGSPFFFTPRRWSIAALKVWGRTSNLLLKIVCGLTMEVRGAEHIPKGAALVAGKHQSTWETFALIHLFEDPCLVLKHELSYFPFFGWFIFKFRMIRVRRSAGAAALKAMTAQAAREAAAGRQIVIYPEGTRRAPDDPPAYKPGASALYLKLGVPCVPFALNSGLHWPRRGFVKRPGTIIVEFLPAIPPGLKRREFETRLETAIETATARLLDEGRERLKRR